MAWPVTGNVTKFPEAAAWFRSQLPVTKDLAERMSLQAGKRAWTITGVNQLNVAQSTFDSLARAIEQGIPFEEWQKKAGPALTKQWGQQDSARMELIYRNATQQAHNAGRWFQQTRPTVVERRPYLRFVAKLDSRTSPICRAWHGVVLLRKDFPPDMHPQLHHGCRSKLLAKTEKQALQLGITTTHPSQDNGKPWIAQNGFGDVPGSKDFTPERARYFGQLFDEYQHKRQQLSTQSRRPRLDE